jgi:chromosome segregation ATPase
MSRGTTLGWVASALAGAAFLIEKTAKNQLTEQVAKLRELIAGATQDRDQWRDRATAAEEQAASLGKELAALKSRVRELDASGRRLEETIRRAEAMKESAGKK